MFMIMTFFSWWYSAGWLGQINKAKLNMIKLADLFSISLLLRTLFAPFHQYSANDTGRGPSEAMKAWANRTFSRLFGFIIRLLTIIIGLITLLLALLLELVWLVVWFVIPPAPLIYIALIMTGVF
jgi:hypothetical protein